MKHLAFLVSLILWTITVKTATCYSQSSQPQQPQFLAWDAKKDFPLIRKWIVSTPLSENTAVGKIESRIFRRFISMMGGVSAVATITYLKVPIPSEDKLQLNIDSIENDLREGMQIPTVVKRRQYQAWVFEGLHKPMHQFVRVFVRKKDNHLIYATAMFSQLFADSLNVEVELFQRILTESVMDDRRTAFSDNAKVGLLHALGWMDSVVPNAQALDLQSFLQQGGSQIVPGFLPPSVVDLLTGAGIQTVNIPVGSVPNLPNISGLEIKDGAIQLNVSGTVNTNNRVDVQTTVSGGLDLRAFLDQAQFDQLTNMVNSARSDATRLGQNAIDEVGRARSSVDRLSNELRNLNQTGRDAIRLVKEKLTLVNAAALAATTTLVTATVTGAVSIAGELLKSGVGALIEAIFRAERDKQRAQAFAKAIHKIHALMDVKRKLLAEMDGLTFLSEISKKFNVTIESLFQNSDYWTEFLSMKIAKVLEDDKTGKKACDGRTTQAIVDTKKWIAGMALIKEKLQKAGFAGGTKGYCNKISDDLRAYNEVRIELEDATSDLSEGVLAWSKQIKKTTMKGGEGFRVGEDNRDSAQKNLTQLVKKVGEKDLKMLKKQRKEIIAECIKGDRDNWKRDGNTDGLYYKGQGDRTTEGDSYWISKKRCEDDFAVSPQHGSDALYQDKIRTSNRNTTSVIDGVMEIWKMGGPQRQDRGLRNNALSDKMLTMGSLFLEQSCYLDQDRCSRYDLRSMPEEVQEKMDQVYGNREREFLVAQKIDEVCPHSEGLKRYAKRALGTENFPAESFKRRSQAPGPQGQPDHVEIEAMEKVFEILDGPVDDGQ